MKSSLSLRLQPAVGRRGSFGSAACIALLALTAAGCAPAEGKPEQAESVSVSPFSDPEDPTPKVPEYTVRDGLELNTQEEQLAEEAVVFFEEYMAAANRAYRDGGVYWDKYIDLGTKEFQETLEADRADSVAEGFHAKSDLKTDALEVNEVDSDASAVFVTSCFAYKTWERETSEGPVEDPGALRDVTMGLSVVKTDKGWKAEELSKERDSCGGQ